MARTEWDSLFSLLPPEKPSLNLTVVAKTVGVGMYCDEDQYSLVPKLPITALLK
jgi:hypothetical protein